MREFLRMSMAFAGGAAIMLLVVVPEDHRPQREPGSYALIGECGGQIYEFDEEDQFPAPCDWIVPTKNTPREEAAITRAFGTEGR